MQQSSDGTQTRLGVSLNHMAKKKEKFFLELDEEQGLWKIGKSEAPTPTEPQAPVTETAPQVAQPQVAAPQAAPSPAAPAAESTEAAAAVTEPEITFAAANPLPLAQPGRRGPGPSLDTFKAMARQLKRTNF